MGASFGRLLLLAFGLCALVSVPASGWATPEKVGSPAALRVGVETSPPFVFQNEDGTWSGLSITLWEKVAWELGVHYEYVEDLELDLVDLVARGEVDVGIAGLNITRERERLLDFSHPYLPAGLSIAVNRQPSSGFGRVFLVFLNPEVIRSTLVLLGVVVVVGISIWILERRHDPEDRQISSVEDGFWWSVVTMTTVGYGDKTPRTRAGRFLASAWMLVSLGMLTVFTAVLASALTAAQLKRIAGPEDLYRVRVGAVRSSDAAAYLHEHAISFRRFPFLLHALRALRRGEVDAVVHDSPTLKYVVADFHWANLELAGRDFEPLLYAFALPPGSALREKINRAVLLHGPQWRKDVGLRLMNPNSDEWFH